jgi:hypothetical protein
MLEEWRCRCYHQILSLHQVDSMLLVLGDFKGDCWPVAWPRSLLLQTLIPNRNVGRLLRVKKTVHGCLMATIEIVALLAPSNLSTLSYWCSTGSSIHYLHACLVCPLCINCGSPVSSVFNFYMTLVPRSPATARSSIHVFNDGDTKQWYSLYFDFFNYLFCYVSRYNNNMSDI